MKHFLLLPTLLLFSLLVAACVDDGDRAAAPDPTVTQAPEPTPEVYVAQPGDYLALIADKLDVPLSQLLELNDIPDPSTIKIGQEIVIREAAPLPDLPPPAVTTDAPASEIATEEDARWPFGVTSDQAKLAALGTAALAATFALLLFLRAAVRVIVGYGSRVGRRIARRQTASGQSGADTSLIAADPNRCRGWLRRAFSALGRQSVAVLRRVATGLRALPAVIGRLAARLRGLLRRSPSAGRPGGAAALATTARSSGGLRRSPQPLATAARIETACLALRLPTVREQAGPLAEAAVRDRLTHNAYLAELLAAELDDRQARRRERRIAEARFPIVKHLADFDLSAAPTVDPATLAALETGAWIDAGEPVVLLGDSGTGKSHLLIGLGMAACERGLRVRYVTAAALANELAEALDERKLPRVVARYGRLDLLCLDEFGYVHLDPRGAELLFQVLTDREERASVAVASSAPFSEWGQTFTDPRLAAAVVDRLASRAHILETGSESYRLQNGKTRKGAAPHGSVAASSSLM